jgi:hypothetical protein
MEPMGGKTVLICTPTMLILLREFSVVSGQLHTYYIISLCLTILMNYQFK